jgi:hypothetical protein
MLLALSALAVGFDLPPLARAVVCLPAVLWGVGNGWARWLGKGERDPLQVGLDAIWISVLFLIPSLAVVKVAGGGAGTLLATSAVFCGLGTWLGWSATPRRRLSPRAGVGLAVAALLLLGTAVWKREALGRPLDAFWYADGLEDMSATPVPWSPEQGWDDNTPLGWEELGVGRLDDAAADGGRLNIQERGHIVLLLRAPVGAGLRAKQFRSSVGDTVDDSWTEWARVESDPTQLEEEGPVPRYLDRGVVALPLDVQPGSWTVQVDSPEPVSVYVLPAQEAQWSLHASGDLQLVHYYQILNIVENQRWALELLDNDRWVTVNQPPLWTWVLATSSLLVSADVVGANLLFLAVLGILSVAGVRLLQVVAPAAPWPAWALPGAMAVVHLKLMLEPGSTNFPDSLYAAAFVTALVAMHQKGALRFALIAVAAGLLRYPGTIALTLLLGTYALAYRSPPWRKLAWTWGLVGGIASALAVFGALTGQLHEWLGALWFETGPEHYNNNQEAPPLLGRPPLFYWTWLKYTGFGLLAVLPWSGRASRWVFGSAAIYSLMLCTIDHFPSHYFLPLLALSAVAVGANAAGFKRQWIGWVLASLGVAGAVGFVLAGTV